jgi:hypothetical protein
VVHLASARLLVEADGPCGTDVLAKGIFALLADYGLVDEILPGGRNRENGPSGVVPAANMLRANQLTYSASGAAIEMRYDRGGNNLSLLPVERMNVSREKSQENELYYTIK